MELGGFINQQVHKDESQHKPASRPTYLFGPLIDAKAYPTRIRYYHLRRPK